MKTISFGEVPYLCFPISFSFSFFLLFSFQTFFISVFFSAGSVNLQLIMFSSSNYFAFFLVSVCIYLCFPCSIYSSQAAERTFLLSASLVKYFFILFLVLSKTTKTAVFRRHFFFAAFVLCAFKKAFRWILFCFRRMNWRAN